MNLVLFVYKEYYKYFVPLLNMCMYIGSDAQKDYAKLLNRYDSGRKNTCKFPVNAGYLSQRWICIALLIIVTLCQPRWDNIRKTT